MSVQSTADARRRAASRLIVVLFVVTLAALTALLVPVTSSSTSQAAANPQTVITSDLHAWKWDPTHPTAAGALYDDPRTVTVDQTEDLVSQVVHVSWANFSSSSTTNAINPGFYPVHVYECDTADPAEPSHCFGDADFVTTHPGDGNVGDQTNSIQTFTGVGRLGQRRLQRPHRRGQPRPRVLARPRLFARRSSRGPAGSRPPPRAARTAPTTPST